ncbi:hypothetical protein [Pseudomonas xanthosomatis]|uniref:hypothetical protein n=1 Tax=Pseudomonas xanthosomatis TaxID=2842356 RepID=UPI003518877A
MNWTLKLLLTFSGTFSCALALWSFELWGGNPKRIPSLLLLVITGVLALAGLLKCFDENFRKWPLAIGIFPTVIIFMASAVSIRHGWLGFFIDIDRPGQIGNWMLAMMGIQAGQIIIYKCTLKTKSSLSNS